MARIPREVVEHFAGIPLFRDVSKKGLRAIVSAADELDVPAGRTVVREGEHGEEMYVLISGAARVSRKGRTLGTIGPGGFFGEMALLSRAPRNATVTVTEDARLMLLTPSRFHVILDNEPTIARCVMSVMADRLRESERSPTH